MAQLLNDYSKLIDNALHSQKNLATEPELTEYAAAALLAFQEADIDNSETLTITELIDLCLHMGLPMENDEEEALMKMDADDSGSISIEEWLAWWLKRVSCLPNPVKQQESIARNTFKKFDVDKSGTLEMSELNELLKSLGAKFSSQEMNEALNELDSDKSGFIEINEFIDWWIQRSVQSRSSTSLVSIKLKRLARKASQIFYTDIFTAVWNNDIDLVNTFLESDVRMGSGSDMSEYGDGWNPLHYACYRGYIDIVQKLLDIRVSVNAVNNSGFTALFYAAQRGYINICKLLLDKSADPSICGSIDDMFLCPVDHCIDFPDLTKLFKSHPHCAMPEKPPTANIIVTLNENTGLINLTLPLLKSFSFLPIKKWHVIITTLICEKNERPFEIYVNGISPTSIRKNHNSEITFYIDKKWLKLKSILSGCLPELLIQISGLNSFNDKSPYSDDIKISLSNISAVTTSTNASIANRLNNLETIQTMNDEYENEFNNSNNSHNLNDIDNYNGNYTGNYDENYSDNEGKEREYEEPKDMFTEQIREFEGENEDNEDNEEIHIINNDNDDHDAFK